MSRYTAGAPVSTSSLWIALATASRGASSSTKRSPAASCSVAPSPRIASVTRKPSRPLTPDDRGRVELDELEVGELGAGGAGEQQARAVRAGRVRGARPQRGGAARGEDHRARRRSSGRPRWRPRDRAPSAPGSSARTRRPSSTSIPRVRDDLGRELAQDPAAGRAAAGVDDAAHAVPALQAQRELAVAVGVEADAEPLEVGEAGGRLVAQHLGGARGGRGRGRRSACPRGAAPGSRPPRARRRGRPAPSRTRSRRAGGRRPA